MHNAEKKKNLTQAQLAEKLNITDRAVSKWETGKGMPDASIMIELCEILDISVNELFSGEKLNMEDYNKVADENLVELQKRNEALSKAGRFGFGITLILLLMVFTLNIYTYGVQEAITMPAFIIMQTVLIVWLLIYQSVLNKVKKK